MVGSDVRCITDRKRTAWCFTWTASFETWLFQFTAWIIYVYNQCSLTHLMSGTIQRPEFMLHYVHVPKSHSYNSYQSSLVLRSTREVGIIGVSFRTSAAAATSMLCVQGGDIFLGCGQSRGWQVTPPHGPNAPVSLKLSKL